MLPVACLLVTWSTTARAAAPLPPAPKAHDPHPSDVAVVVAVEDYFVLPDAPGATADAQAVRDTLIQTRGVPEDRVAMLVVGASREKILAAAEAAGEQAGLGATVWFYFAGHGLHDREDGTLRLLGVDAQPEADALLPRAISLDDLAERLRAGGGQPVFWLDAGYGPEGRAGRALGHGVAPYADAEVQLPVTAPKGSIVWTASPAASPQVIDGHGAFTWLSVGALRGWADGAGDEPEDGNVTPDEAQRWVSTAAIELDVAPPYLLGDTTALAWATGVTADPPALSANDVRSPEARGDDDGPPDVAESADDILTDARQSLRRMAVGFGGDVPDATRYDVQVGRVTGRSEDEGLAPALAEHLDQVLPDRVRQARFAAYTSHPPLSARVVTVNFDLMFDGEPETYLVEGVALPSSPNWKDTAEQIGRRLMDQLEPGDD